MSLQDMLKEKIKLNEDTLVARFNNGFEVAYERQVEKVMLVVETPNGRHFKKYEDKDELESRVNAKYTLLSWSGICSGHNSYDIETGKPDSFSHGAEELINEHIRRSPNAHGQWLDKLGDVGSEIYNHVTQPLEIEQFTYRNWKELGQRALLTFGSPFFILHYLIKGHKDDASGDAGLAIMAAPLLIPHVVKELFVPRDTLGSAYRVGNRSPLLKENDDTRAACIFNYDNNPKRFTSLEVIFPDGLTLNERGVCRYKNQEYVMGRYKDAKYFLDVDPKYSEAVNDVHNSYEAQWDEWHGFRKVLEESDQKAFLENIGFLEAE